MHTTLFSELGLSAETLKAIDKLGFEQAAPIQASAIPILMSGGDVVGQCAVREVHHDLAGDDRYRCTGSRLVPDEQRVLDAYRIKQGETAGDRAALTGHVAGESTAQERPSARSAMLQRAAGPDGGVAKERAALKCIQRR